MKRSKHIAALIRKCLAAACLLPAVAHAGLDVTAFEKLVLVPVPQVDKDGQPTVKNQVKLSPGEIVQRFDGLSAGAVYHYDQAFDFRAGSYSGYNYWRNELAKLAGYKPTPFKSFNGNTELRYDATVWKIQTGPFWELIDFSDAEGVIGPAVCKRVYLDFVKYQSAAAQHPDAYFRSSYQDWMKAFAMCANDGAIVFH